MANNKKAEKQAEDKANVIAAIKAMSEPDQSTAKRIHEIITKNAPSLMPRTWYGMPAYSNGDKIVCFFQGKEKFKTRYATLGFMHEAKLDEGNLWPVSFAVIKLTPEDEEKITELVKKALS